jgi:hypothetical protein
VLRSDAQGHFSLDSAALGSMLEATANSGVQWLPAPVSADRISVELAASLTRTLIANSSVELRAALLFEDGHCVPFGREGKTNRWSTVAPGPAREDDWPVLIVEATGFATIVRAWFDSERVLELSLHPAKPVIGACSGDRATLVNPFQSLVTRVDRAGQFAFTGVLDFDSDVRCLRGGTTSQSWTYSPEAGLTIDYDYDRAPAVSGDSCRNVHVVDRAGRPIAGAELRFDGTSGETYGLGGALTYADSRGMACVEDAYEGGKIIVHPPPDRGGWCAGEAKVALAHESMQKSIRVVLDVRPLPRSRFRARLVSPEKLPIVGAHVAVREVHPAGASGCSENPQSTVNTGPDGRFELPLLPNGRLKFFVQHHWYAAREIELTLPSSEREIELDRGVSWTGRVLDPDGKVIDDCTLFLTLPDQRLLTARCSAQGFSFRTLAPGNANLSVRVQKHALGTYRSLDQTIEIKPGSSFVRDIRWPRGEAIAGRVVDQSGVPVAGARLTALPKGTPEAVNRFVPGEVMLEADRDGRFTFRHLAPGVWTIRGDRRARTQSTLDVTTGTRNVKFVTGR